MSILNRLKNAFHRKHNWNDLTSEQQIVFTKKVMSTIKALSGARYKIVSGSDELQRERGVTETKGEDEILNQSNRGKLLDLARNSVRNNPTFVTVLKQFDLNAIGSNGGKAILTFTDEEFGKTV